MISLTPRAAQKIKVLAQKQGKAGAFLRLRVIAGGCSGMSYEFEITEQAAADDVVCELDGAKTAVDPKSHLFVSGSTIDYAESLMKSGFEVTNPKAVSTCSCGSSFATETPREETFNV